MTKNISDNIIKETYEMLQDYHARYLKKHGVRLPNLYYRENYSKNGLTLIYLAQGYPNTKAISKEELTQFIRVYYPNTQDVQQARHLAAQDGWFIASGARGNSSTIEGIDLKWGRYRLVTLEEPYPGFKKQRREKSLDRDTWEDLKKRYDYRCATCGSKEGDLHYHWPNTITELQRSHMDPGKPFTKDNAIPQCSKCNRADRNNWVYDEKGRVIKLANPLIITRSNKKVRREVYKILCEEFGKGKRE